MKRMKFIRLGFWSLVRKKTRWRFLFGVVLELAMFLRDDFDQWRGEEEVILEPLREDSYLIPSQFFESLESRDPWFEARYFLGVPCFDPPIPPFVETWVCQYGNVLFSWEFNVREKNICSSNKKKTVAINIPTFLWITKH